MMNEDTTTNENATTTKEKCCHHHHHHHQQQQQQFRVCNNNNNNNNNNPVNRRPAAFYDIMTDLCLSLTLSYLTPIEQIDSDHVSKLWSHIVRNSCRWKKATYLIDNSENSPAAKQPKIVLPPQHICAMLYGLTLKDCSNDLLLTVLSRISTVRSLQHTHHHQNFEKEKARENATTIQQELNHALKLLSLESLKCTLNDALFSALLDSQTNTNNGQCHALYNITPPAIWTYQTTLTSLNLSHTSYYGDKITLATLLHSFATALMQNGAWPALCTIKLSFFDPWNSWSLDSTLLRVFLTDRFLPSLTSLDIEFHLNTFRMSIVLQNLFAGDKLPALQYLKHTFTRCEEYDNRPGGITRESELAQLLQIWKDTPIVYAKNLTSLIYDRQEVHWNVLHTMKSLTELRISAMRNPLQRSVELFDIIGAHNLSHLATLSIEVTDEPMFSDSGTSDYARVCEIMSGMYSLTSLHSSAVMYECSSDSFNWFAHAYLFPNLCKIHYLHYLQGGGAFWRHTPLPLPIGVAASVMRDHLLYSSQPRIRHHHHHLLQYIYTGDRSINEKYQAITVQLDDETEETSFEELRLMETEIRTDGAVNNRRNVDRQQTIAEQTTTSSSSSLFQPFTFSAPPPSSPSSPLTLIYAHIFLSGRIVSLYVDIVRGRIDDIKLAYERSEGITTDRIRMIFQGKNLDDSKLMSHYGIKEKSAMHVIFRMSGVTQTRKDTDTDTQMAY